MNGLIEEALRLQQFLESSDWRFCFIGGLAVQAWGEPRLTRDIDVSVMTGFGVEDPFVDTLLRQYAARLSGAREFALRHRTVLLRTESGIGIDVSLAALPFEDEMMDRAVPVEMTPGRALRVCSAEDLLIMKIFAGRDTDLRDARSIVARQAMIDWDHVEHHLRVLDELRGTSRAVETARALRRNRDH